MAVRIKLLKQQFVRVTRDSRPTGNCWTPVGLLLRLLLRLDRLICKLFHETNNVLDSKPLEVILFFFFLKMTKMTVCYYQR